MIIDGWQKLALVKEANTVQVQVDNDGDESYVDLPLHEVKKLVASLKSWIEEKVPTDCEKEILTLKILHNEAEESSTLSAVCEKNGSLRAVAMPLMMLVDKMIDTLDENPNATLLDMGILATKEVDNG